MPSLTVGARCDHLCRSDGETCFDPELSLALWEFCEPSSPTSDDISTRPSKKRRIELDTAFKPNGDPVQASIDYATLVDITLNLDPLADQPVCPEPLTKDSVAVSEPVPVSLVGFFSEDVFRDFSTAVVTLHSSAQHLRLSVDLGLQHPILQHLKIAASLNQRSASNSPNPPLSAVCWNDCYLVRPSRHSIFFSLRIKICWTLGMTPPPFLSIRQVLETFNAAFPNDMIEYKDEWSPQDFYSNVHIPDPAKEISLALQHPSLSCQLYPFQKRTVDWMMRREGVQFDPNGELEPLSIRENLPTSFEACNDTIGNPFYVSHILLEVRSNLEECSNFANFNGGILAEEMGLGKTVELISLILAHRRTGDMSERVTDQYSGSLVQPSGATLIITPSAILEQWMGELATRSPSLRVYHYQGLKESRLSDAELMNELLHQDVVLTTYSVLAKEIHYANDKPDRELRRSKKYEARRTPLIQIGWWRVCLDEAQMIEAGVSNAAKVACLIPRCNAWAVSGTPLKKDVTDMLGLLIFLRYEPFCNLRIWKRLLASHKYLLAEICSKIALRHTKSDVRGELNLQDQKRMVITVPFTATEEQNYTDLFKQMCEDCDLNEDGSPMYGSWDPSSESVVDKMRSWLTRLRQTCLHAEVGSRNRRALGNKSGPLRTVNEVLEVMVDQNELNIRAREREALTCKITQGHIFSFGKESKHALRIYLEALGEAQTMVSESRDRLKEEKANVARSGQEEIKVGSEDSDEDGNIEEEKKGRLGACRLRLRSALEMLHICYFFAGTAHFHVKDDPVLTHPASYEFGKLEKNEADCYEKAKLIRKELLKDVTDKTMRLIEKVNSARSNSLVKLSQIPSFDHKRGLESRKITDAIEDLSYMLNKQANSFEQWRSKLIDTLVEKLLDQDEEADMTGEEYEITTGQQNEQYVLLEALRCVQSDRLCMITGQIGTLVNHEMKSALKIATDGTAAQREDRGPAPELTVSIMTARDSFNPPDNIRATLPSEAVKIRSTSLRGVITDLRQLLTSVAWQGSDRSKLEVQILEKELDDLQGVVKIQSRELAAMEKEIELLRSTMNQRLEFYKQLQRISDTVAPFQEAVSDTVDYGRILKEQKTEDNIRDKVSLLKTKRRFLIHLRNSESDDGQEQKICVICQSKFETGVLTVCGHQYCKDCIRLWWRRHKTCPMCKTQLKEQDFHDITYKSRDLCAQEEKGANIIEEGNQSSASPSPPKASIYSDVNDVTLQEIKNVELPGSQSFGIKIDTIARHLLWIREKDPGSKAVIFSQYRDFLGVLGKAFQIYRIGYSEIASKDGINRFRDDPSTECFLLHAKAESSGLTLVNAAHVILCEPLINTALELQAIARVHRIGQHRQTTVWMHLVANTVEEAIYAITVSRRLAHVQQSGSSSQHRSRAGTPTNGGVEESKLEAANSLELQAAPISKLLAKGGSGGEVVGKEDLWNCLFDRSKRDSQTSVGALENLSPDNPGAREMGRFLRAEAAERRIEEG